MATYISRSDARQRLLVGLLAALAADLWNSKRFPLVNKFVPTEPQGDRWLFRELASFFISFTCINLHEKESKKN